MAEKDVSVYSLCGLVNRSDCEGGGGRKEGGCEGQGNREEKLHCCCALFVLAQMRVSASMSVAAGNHIPSSQSRHSLSLWEVS